MMPEARLLLIIACSQKKRTDPGLLSAIERYDGGTYRVLRRAKREGYLSQKLDVLILSAKYGLIDALTPIADYEQRMTPARAKELQSQVVEFLKATLEKNSYCFVYVDLGNDYSLAIKDLNEVFPSTITITFAHGRIGERLSKLKSWLLEKSEEH